MQPTYFNPTNPAQLSATTNPMDTATIVPSTTQPKFFNPSLYDSFTFSQFPELAYSTTLTGGTTALTGGGVISEAVYSFATDTAETVISGETFFYTSFFENAIIAYASSQFLTLFATNADYQQLQSVTFSQRFGTELQTIYDAIVDPTYTSGTYTNVIAQYYNTIFTVVDTYSYDPSTPSSSLVTQSTTPQTGSAGFVALYTSPFAINTFAQNITTGTTYTLTLGSSQFVEMLGSNVYTGLLITTNSIIDYENEQISSYYSQSLSYQINIANLTSALNSVSQTDTTDATGNGNMVVTTFSWVWFTTTGGMSGSQVTNFPGYLSTQVVNNYLSTNYNTTITNSADAVTQVQSLISVQNNDLENAQTFLNNSVTTLQSQVSLAGQIIASLASATQAIISNI